MVDDEESGFVPPLVTEICLMFYESFDEVG
jgi:hypothetical protein